MQLTEKLFGLKPFTFIGTIVIIGMFVLAGLDKVNMNDLMDFVWKIFMAMSAPVVVTRFMNGQKEDK